MDFVATTTYAAPTVIESFEPLAGELFGTITKLRFVARRPALPRVGRAEAASTNKVLQLDALDAPEHIALRRLRLFKTFSANWDAERAAAPSHAAIDLAIILLSLLSAHGATPSVALTSEGVPMFLLQNGDVAGEVIVKADGRIDYYFDTPDGDGDSDVVFDARSIPAALLERIQA